MNNQRGSQSVRLITRGAIVAALYVALTYLSALFGLASGVIQFRLSEALCVLPMFMPEAIAGLTVGCLISNILTGGVPMDVICGSLATLLGAVGAYLLRRISPRLSLLATLPTVLANALIIPPVLIFAYGATDGYLFILATVTLGEVVTATGLGGYLGYSLKKTDLLGKMGIVKRR